MQGFTQNTSDRSTSQFATMSTMLNYQYDEDWKIHASHTHVHNSLSLFLPRYEVESGENRLLIAYEICRRFLGIQSDVKINNDDKTSNEVTDSNEKTELNNVNQTNNVVSPKHHTNEKEIDKSDEFTGDDLVVDILNDELISQVKDKSEGK